VIRRTVDAARSQRIFRTVEVALNLSPDIPEITADPDRLRQVFMNLLLNAVQAMPEGGKIVVSTEFDKDGGLIKATFRDTGTGIPREEQEKVFEPFFTTKRPGEGTGLGLAICARLLEEHGGTVEVSSEPGKGSLFTVTLPIAGPGINPEKA
jgi:two-component system NtrC family sensor kinase